MAEVTCVADDGGGGAVVVVDGVIDAGTDVENRGQRVEAIDRRQNRLGKIAGVKEFSTGAAVAPDVDARRSRSCRPMQLVDNRGSKVRTFRIEGVVAAIEI